MAKKSIRRKLNKKDLKVKKTPMPKRNIGFSKRGKKFDMTLCRFIQNLFELNCVYKPTEKMTDGEIARQIRLEYSHLDNIVKRFSTDNPKLSSVLARLRSEYNRGKLIPSVGPPTASQTSFAYNEEGTPVNMRYNTPKPWTVAQMKEQRAIVGERRRLFLEQNPEHE